MLDNDDNDALGFMFYGYGHDVHSQNSNDGHGQKWKWHTLSAHVRVRNRPELDALCNLCRKVFHETDASNETYHSISTTVSTATPDHFDVDAGPARPEIARQLDEIMHHRATALGQLQVSSQALAHRSR